MAIEDTRAEECVMMSLKRIFVDALTGIVDQWWRVPVSVLGLWFWVCGSVCVSLEPSTHRMCHDADHLAMPMSVVWVTAAPLGQPTPSAMDFNHNNFYSHTLYYNI